MSNNYANNANLTTIMIAVGDKIKEKGVASTVTGTALMLTDAASGYVQSVTIKGNSEVASGEIASVGDDGLTITSTDGTASTIATITTGLPLRSVSDSITDEVDNDKIVTRCNEIDLGSLHWEIYSSANKIFYSDIISDAANGVCISTKYTCSSVSPAELSDNNYTLFSNKRLYIRDVNYTDPIIFATSLAGVKLVYPLATPTETPLTSAEKAALAALRTYSGTTNISATGSPLLVIDYLKNTDNGKAVANVDNKVKNKQDKLTFDATPTADSNNPVTSGGIKAALDTKQNALTAGTNITISEDQQSGNLIISASAGGSSGDSGETFPAKYKTWANATDAEIAELLAAHDAGEIDIYDRWRVGERRKIEITTYEHPRGLDLGEASNFTLDAVLYNCGYYCGGSFKEHETELNTNNKKIHYIVGLEGFPYKFYNYFNSSYKYSNIRYWLNNTFYYYLPESFRNLLKPMTYKLQNIASNIELYTLSDYITIPAVREITTGFPYSYTDFSKNDQNSSEKYQEYLFDYFYSPGSAYIFENKTPNSADYILTRNEYSGDNMYCIYMTTSLPGMLRTGTVSKNTSTHILMICAI